MTAATNLLSLNKHQLKTEATRQKLLSAALRVFARDGFERSRLEDIAAEAGHTRGAFYANFTTKEDLFIALLKQQAAKRTRKVMQLLEFHADAEDRRLALRKFYLSCTKDRQQAMLMLEFKLYALRHSKNRAKFAAAHQQIRESFQIEVMSKLKRSPKGVQMDEHGKILLEVIRVGLVLEHAYDPRRISAEEVTELLGQMFDVLTRDNTF